MNTDSHLFSLMNNFFWGFIVSLLYGIITGILIYRIESIAATQAYIKAFFSLFNCAMSGGLIIGAAILIRTTQHFVPNIIESTFHADDLATTTYKKQRKRFFSSYRSTTFASEFAVVGFVIFYYAKFPLVGAGEYFMITFGCIQYALGVYVGRKLFYISQMLNSIQEIEIRKDVFKEDRLGGISTYVNAVSTFTMVFVYIHVTSYYRGPFLYNTIIQDSIRNALLLPAIIAAPVIVLFNFYPREVLRRIYARSISIEIAKLTNKLRTEDLSAKDRMSCVIEYDKISKDELRYRLRVTFSDLPIGISLFILIFQLLK